MNIRLSIASVTTFNHNSIPSRRPGALPVGNIREISKAYAPYFS